MKSRPSNDKIAAMMNPADRKAMGIETAEEFSARIESDEEAELQKACDGALRLRGIPVDHLPRRVRCLKGRPDLPFPLNGHYIACELKSSKGKLDPDQVDWLTMAHNHGARCYVIRRFVVFLDILAGKDVEQWKPENQGTADVQT